MTEIELYEAAKNGQVLCSRAVPYGKEWKIETFEAPKYNNYELHAAMQFINTGSAPKAYTGSEWKIFPSKEESAVFLQQEDFKRSESMKSDFF